MYKKNQLQDFAKYAQKMYKQKPENSLF